jgi:DDE superfamily endonuclease
VRSRLAYLGRRRSEKNELKPHRRQIWCIGTITAAFLARLEQILALYALPYDPAYPVVCFDERPCFLIGDILLPRPMRKGEIEKQHYEYEKLGSCALLAAIEPLTGRRLAQLHERRTKKEFTLFCQQLSAAYPTAKRIRVVLDNLNTHNASSFYEHLSAEEAFALTERFEFIYTPKGASWLNLIECEFSVIARQCLDRRIATIECLRSEVLALLEARSAKAIKIHWQFSIAAARAKLNSQYTRVNSANEKYKET